MRVSRLRDCWPDRESSLPSGHCVIAVDRQNIDELRAGLLLIGVELLQQPGIVIGLAVRVVVGVRRAESVRLVEAR